MNQLHSIPMNVLRGELLKRDMTLSDFACRHGFPEIAVLVAFRRHCGNYDSNPRGKLTKAIVRKLYEEIQTPTRITPWANRTRRRTGKGPSNERAQALFHPEASRGSPPEIPLHSWQFFFACRKILSDSFLTKVFKRSLREIQRWTADPTYAEDVDRNPVDRYEAVLVRLMELGRSDIARAEASRQAHVVGCELRCTDELKPDRSTITDEILDNHPPLVAFHQAIRNGEDAVVVHQLYQDARREIEETHALYARSVAKVGS
ncbi:MAG: hypothetical protein AB9866_18600 [Syntrophobacteraceae bacterium]